MGGPHPHEPDPAEPVTEEAILDIGGDVGALILHADAAFRGREIEVSPVGSDGNRVHTAIRERRIRGAVRFAGIYPALPAGQYRIWAPEPGLADRVTIVGGEVAEIDWRRGA